MHPMNLAKIFSDLNRQHQGIDASAIISNTGLALFHDPMPGVDPDHASALSAAMLTWGEYATKNLFTDTLDHVELRCSQGNILLSRVSPDALIAILTRNDVVLEQISNHLHHVLDEVSTTALG